MKRLAILSILGIVAVSATISHAATLDFTPTAEELALGYHEDPSTHDITFLFVPATWGYTNPDAITSVQVQHLGFTTWTHDKEELQPDEATGIYFVTVPYDTVKRPCIIGQPCYRFVVNGKGLTPYEGYPEDYVYQRNSDRFLMVVFSFDDLEQVRAGINAWGISKYPSDFDLTTRYGQEEVSNYRTVPGTNLLRRSWHPFKSCGSGNMSTEYLRLMYLGKLGTEDGVKSLISLCGDNYSNPSTYKVDGKTYQEVIPQYVTDAINNGHVLIVGQGYAEVIADTAYYRSDSDTFAHWVGDIIHFIDDDNNQAPFQMHCLVGSDRTGIFSAVIAALCDAQPSEIYADFDKTNRLGIKQWRSTKLVKYSLEHMLGVSDIDDMANFNDAVRNHFIDSGYVTGADIDKMHAKLLGLRTDMDMTSTPATNAAVKVFTPQGVEVFAGAREAMPRLGKGLYIIVSGDRSEKVMYK